MEAAEGTVGLIRIKCTRAVCRRKLELRFPFESRKTSGGERGAAHGKNPVAVT
jgi:hypothetical protein